MNRRNFMIGAAATMAAVAVSRPSAADVPALRLAGHAADGFEDIYIDWMVKNRGEDPLYLGQRCDRFLHLVDNRDLFNDRNKRAFLMTPREEFVPEANLARAYERDFLDIGYGVTISGPHLVGRMTSSIDVEVRRKGARGRHRVPATSRPICPTSPTRSGRSRSSSRSAERTRGTYDALIARGYSEYKAITTKNADGYYGWEEAGPFDKIIVTCGIDHVPPPLLRS